MNIMDEQWKDILSEGAFSEEGKFVLVTGEEFTCRGIYYSGSYTEESSAAYSDTRWEREDYFQISPLSLPECVTCPELDLRNAELQIDGRGLFRVHQVKGAQSGMLTIFVQPKEFEYA